MFVNTGSPQVCSINKKRQAADAAQCKATHHVFVPSVA